LLSQLSINSRCVQGRLVASNPGGRRDPCAGIRIPLEWSPDALGRNRKDLLYADLRGLLASLPTQFDPRLVPIHQHGSRWDVQVSI